IVFDFRNNLLRVEKEWNRPRVTSASVDLMQQRGLADASWPKQQNHLVSGVVELMSDPFEIVLAPEKHLRPANGISDDIVVRDLRERHLSAKRHEHLIEGLRQFAKFVVAARSRQLGESALRSVSGKLGEFGQRHTHPADQEGCE